MRDNERLRKDLRELTCWKNFVDVLAKYDLKLSDLPKYSTLKQSQLTHIKKVFKGKEQNKRKWCGFKKTGLAYYLITQMSPTIALSNKNNSKVEGAA